MIAQDLQDAHNEEIIAEMQETQHISTYNGGYDSQAEIGETENALGVLEIVCIEDMVFAVNMRRVTMRVFQRN